MFPAPLHTRLPAAPAPRYRRARPAQLSTSRLRVAPGFAGVVVLLSATLPTGASAQSAGTMQVTAQVLPARPSWTALNETLAAARRLAGAPSLGITIRRTGLLRTEAVLLPAHGGRLVVTVQHPYN